MPAKNKNKIAPQKSKTKYQLEFLIRSSPRILYPYLSTSDGLGDWFADKVQEKGKNMFIFKWQDAQAEAELISKKENHHVRFKWVAEPADTYFQFDIVLDEMTSEVALMITDFATDDQKEENSLLWNSQVHALMHVIGA